MRRTVRQLLGSKGHEVWSIGPDDSVYDAIAAMAHHECGALVVLEDDALVGIISERDYARKVILAGRASRSTTVREVMTTVVHTVSPTHSLEDCMQVMTSRRVRHLPVMVERRVVGMLSVGDVIKAMLHERESTIRELEQYIRS